MIAGIILAGAICVSAADKAVLAGEIKTTAWYVSDMLVPQVQFDLFQRKRTDDYMAQDHLKDLRENVSKMQAEVRILQVLQVCKR